MTKNRFDCETNGVADILYDCAEDIMLLENPLNEWYNNYGVLIDPKYLDVLKSFYNAIYCTISSANYILTSYASNELQKE